MHKSPQNGLSYGHACFYLRLMLLPPQSPSPNFHGVGWEMGRRGDGAAQLGLGCSRNKTPNLQSHPKPPILSQTSTPTPNLLSKPQYPATHSTQKTTRTLFFPSPPAPQRGNFSWQSWKTPFFGTLPCIFPNEG